MLMLKDNLGAIAPASEEDILREARKVVCAHLQTKGEEFVPETAKRLLPILIGDDVAEAFYLIHLDTRDRIIAFEQMFKGTIDQTAAYPREVLRSVIKHNSYAVAAVHNHPSSASTNPSDNDLKLSQRLGMMLKLIDVQLVDHFIVAGADVYSMAEHARKEVNPLDIIRLLAKHGLTD
jgi:DNA repair protein RadC